MCFKYVVSVLSFPNKMLSELVFRSSVPNRYNNHDVVQI